MNFESINFEALQDMLGSMSESDMENLASVAAEIFSSGGGQKTQQKQESSAQFDFESISRIMGIINKLNSQPQDPGCELLSALKPMLSTKRQKKADEAISMLRLISLLPLLGEAMN